MVSRPNADLSVGGGGTTALVVRDWLHQLLGWAEQLPGGVGLQSLTISDGIVTPNRARVVVDTEAGSTTDELLTIGNANLPDGSIIVVSSVDSSRKPVLVHRTTGEGHIFLHGGSDLTLESSSNFVMFERTGSRWRELFRWYGTTSSAWRAFFGIGNAGALDLALISEAKAGTRADRLMSPARTKNALDDAALMVTGRASASPLDGSERLMLAKAGALVQADALELKAWIQSPDWYSGLLAFDASVTEAHPLGSMPSRMEVHAVCFEADLGYPTGFRATPMTDDTGGSARTLSAGFDAEEVFISRSSALRMRPKGGGSPAAMTPSKWRWEFKLWR